MSNFPAQGRDDIVKEMIGMRSKFQNYKSFATPPSTNFFPLNRWKKHRCLKPLISGHPFAEMTAITIYPNSLAT